MCMCTYVHVYIERTVVCVIKMYVGTVICECIVVSFLKLLPLWDSSLRVVLLITEYCLYVGIVWWKKWLPTSSTAPPHKSDDIAHKRAAIHIKVTHPSC